MRNQIKYFDHAATTSVREEVLKEMLPYFSVKYGNPSSVYGLGRKSKKAIEEARKKVANSINANPSEIYFTSGGSESDNLAIKGIARSLKNMGNHIITSNIEHHAVINSCKSLEKEGFYTTYLNVNKDGFINLRELENAITNETILITIMTANNEIGTIQPIAEIGRIAKYYNICFHTDSVQAIGNMKIDVKSMHIDSLSIAAHKFYGPKGVGALYVREGVPLNKIQDGGHQEKDKRAGTENVAGIVGLGRAIELSNKSIDQHSKKIRELRDYYIKEIKRNIPEIRINGSLEKRLPGNANISFKGVDGNELLYKLDERKICVSAGSACNTGSNKLSHVLTAIGIEPEYINGTLRVTFGDENTLEEVNYLIKNLKEVIEECRR